MGSIREHSGPSMARRRNGATRLASLMTMTTALITVPVIAGASDSSPSWRAVWNRSPSNAEGSIALTTTQAIRQIVHVSARGGSIRIRLTQRYGTDAVQLSAVSVGKRAQGSETGSQRSADIAPETLHAVTFNGNRAVTIPAGQSVTSDPVDLPITAFDDLVVSFASAGYTALATEHFVARDWPYFSNSGGDEAVDQLDSSGYQRSPLDVLDSYFLLEGIDATDTAATRTLVAVGDSITDGFISAFGNSAIGDPRRNGLNERYPDFLALRLAERDPDRYSVVNAGIAGNQITAPGMLATFGPELLKRLDQDVLAVPGATDVILLEGTNDLGFDTANLIPDASRVISGLKQAVRRMKAANLRVLLGTLTPRDAPPEDGAPEKSSGLKSTINALLGGKTIDQARRKVNDWIRTQNLADGVIDFDACLRDPTATSQLLPAYDSGDHLHPNQNGYSAMADCVDFGLLP